MDTKCAMNFFHVAVMELLLDSQQLSPYRRKGHWVQWCYSQGQEALDVERQGLLVSLFPVACLFSSETEAAPLTVEQSEKANGLTNIHSTVSNPKPF